PIDSLLHDLAFADADAGLEHMAEPADPAALGRLDLVVDPAHHCRPGWALPATFAGTLGQRGQIAAAVADVGHHMAEQVGDNHLARLAGAHRLVVVVQDLDI